MEPQNSFPNITTTHPRRITRSMTRRGKHETAVTRQPISDNLKTNHRSPASEARPARKKSTGKTSRFHKQPWAQARLGTRSPLLSIPKNVLEKAIREAGKPLSEDRFGLIQESIAYNLYALVVQAILWNQTTGKQARPVLEQMLDTYPTPAALASAKFDDVSSMLHPIGLYRSRAKRLIDMGTMWVQKPPVPGRGYAKMRDRKYTDLPLVEVKMEEADIKPELSEEIANSELPTQAKFWEIAHLPGVGPYALDSFRIFHRDIMRGLAEDWLGKGASPNMEPEWRRVVPIDKELRAYLKWLWAREGWEWNWETGRRKQVSIKA